MVEAVEYTIISSSECKDNLFTLEKQILNIFCFQNSANIKIGGLYRRKNGFSRENKRIILVENAVVSGTSLKLMSI